MTVQLTIRQAEIIALVAQGKQIKEIGRKLYLTPETVKSYLKRVRQKYQDDGRDASTLILLMRCAIEDGQIPPILPATQSVILTHADLDRITASLRTVGGAYDLVAAAVERDAAGMVTA